MRHEFQQQHQDSIHHKCYGKSEAYSTDSVSKSLQIEYEVANQLGSKHIPIHCLCKSDFLKKLIQQIFQH